MLACTKDNYKIVEYLLSYQADYKQVNKDGWNAFQIAVRLKHFHENFSNNFRFKMCLHFRGGNENIIENFLRIDPTLSYSVKTKNGRTPCHTAALHGHLNLLKFILKNVENERCKLMLGEKDSCGITPLMDAVLADEILIVEFLIESYDVNDLFFQ